MGRGRIKQNSLNLCQISLVHMEPFPHLPLLTHPVDREAENPHFFPPTPSSRPLPPPAAPKPRSSHRGNQRDRSLPSCPDHRRQHPPPPTTRRPPAPRTLTHDRAAAAAAGCGLRAAGCGLDPPAQALSLPRLGVSSTDVRFLSARFLLGADVREPASCGLQERNFQQ